jgi:hypothetical protein
MHFHAAAPRTPRLPNRALKNLSQIGDLGYARLPPFSDWVHNAGMNTLYRIEQMAENRAMPRPTALQTRIHLSFGLFA